MENQLLNTVRNVLTELERALDIKDATESNECIVRIFNDAGRSTPSLMQQLNDVQFKDINNYDECTKALTDWTKLIGDVTSILSRAHGRASILQPKTAQNEKACFDIRNLLKLIHGVVTKVVDQLLSGNVYPLR